MSKDKNVVNKQVKTQKEENWLDDLIKRQEKDLEVEEEILSNVPNRIKHKYLDEEEE